MSVEKITWKKIKVTLNLTDKAQPVFTHASFCVFGNRQYQGTFSGAGLAPVRPTLMERTPLLVHVDRKDVHLNARIPRLRRFTECIQKYK
ncbi:hypothetical protein BaRGS_00016728 [Batillaria attramentaria]|uniref:Uncharacterized protein n=1 Tax=Batillaria attramentaria TaxID=370345 RepID=A0ABD0KY16_9CAEN